MAGVQEEQCSHRLPWQVPPPELSPSEKRCGRNVPHGATPYVQYVFNVDASNKCYRHQMLPKGRCINHSHILANLFPVPCLLSSSSFTVIVFFASRSIKKGKDLFFPYSFHHNFGAT